jgi:deazaflavin-dependent oxidoreductase (nitroreductase family)
VGIRIPRAVARFNRIVTNPIQSVYAGRLPPWAVIVHTGRRSGREYRTPVVAYTHGGKITVPILYGEESDWVRNLLAAGGGEVIRTGRRYRLDDPEIVDGPAWSSIKGRLTPR